nr:RNA-directed DNA polymerase, eukaryota, reverse transcriptase zinc-binding domain protein [Tanacetum cinerariifolium]
MEWKLALLIQIGRSLPTNLLMVDNGCPVLKDVADRGCFIQESLKERNGRLFKKKISSPDQIVHAILSMVRLKLVTFKFKKMSTRTRMLHDQWKIPSYYVIHDGSSG